MDEKTEGTSPAFDAASRWGSLETEKRPFLVRAREAAALTIPGILPPEGHSGSTELPQPFQSIGARGVNNLASKLLMALWPAGSSCFRLTMDDFVLEELSQQAGDEFEDQRAKFEEALGKVERAVTNKMEAKGTRVIRYEALVHLIVCGNALVQVLKDGSEKFYSLENYCAKRDLAGDLTELVVKETLSRSALPPELRTFLSTIPPTEQPSNADEKTVCLYTWIRRVDGSWKVCQQIAGHDIPGSEGTYPLGKSPWIPLRWRIVPNEDYGRGHCEENSGDLRSLESLRQSLVEITAAVAKVLFMRNPSAVTSAERFAKAPNGAFLDGHKDDVLALQVEKNADFTVAKALYDDIKQSLESAFMMSSSVQRDAERVTAEEIRAMIAELEAALGGIYSLLSEEFQRPLVVRHMHQMQAAGELPQLPEKAVSPQIITGLEGLSRNSDFQRLNALVNDLVTQVGQEAVVEYLNVGGLIKRKGVALSIDTTGLVRSEEEVQKTRQAAAQSQMAEKLGPHLLNLVGKGAEMAQAPQAATPTQ